MTTISELLRKSQNTLTFLDFCHSSWHNPAHWIPPLMIEDSHLQEALTIFEQALEATVPS